MTFLLRFWQPLTALVAAGLIWWGVDSYGDHREAVANARWQARFDAAERRAAEAESRTRALESAAAAISAEWERRYAEQTQTLTARYADADRRMRALSVRLAGACRDNLPEVAGASGGADAAPAGERRAEEAGGRIADVGRDCESDAARLSALQQWIREQRAILRR